MPAFASHYIFARSLKDKIQEYDKDIKLSQTALYYGTQGPDFLFSHRIWRMAWGGKTLKSLGSQLHHCDIVRMFGLMKEYLENEPCDRDIVKSYIYGYICHYALDRNTHPFIYSVQKALTEAKGYQKAIPFSIHNIVEFNIDVFLLRSELGYTDGRKFCAADTVPKDEHVIDEISLLMAYVVPKVNGNSAGAGEYAEAFRDMGTAHKVLTDKNGVKRKVLNIVQQPIKPFIGPLLISMIRQEKPDSEWDYMNFTHKEWTMPYDSRRKSTKSFMDLYREAQTDAMQLIDAFNSGDAEKKLEELTGNMSFDTGVRYDITQPIG
ncbi:MAG: zinc dependent phospholipase C family protein [Oscillospiraceae bacterium]|nr:zinc dependent phospholipase C family protein [Oscillospiraceae bacterium]